MAGNGGLGDAADFMNVVTEAHTEASTVDVLSSCQQREPIPPFSEGLRKPWLLACSWVPWLHLFLGLLGRSLATFSVCAELLMRSVSALRLLFYPATWFVCQVILILICLFAWFGDSVYISLAIQTSCLKCLVDPTQHGSSSVCWH